MWMYDYHSFISVITGKFRYEWDKWLAENIPATWEILKFVQNVINSNKLLNGVT